MSFDFTKVLAAILTALIIGMVTGLVSEGLVEPEKLEKAAYPIAGAGAPAAASAPAEAEAKPAPVTAALLAKADPAKGEEIAKKCAQCHGWDKGGPNKVGPNLYGVVGRDRASAPGFGYSDAIKKLGGKWTPVEIGNFIADPKAYAPGTKMTFVGLPKAEDRADVIAFLNKNSDAPLDLSKAE